MLSFFRRVSKSKIGTGIMAFILVAILAGFAVADLSNFGSGQIGFGMSSARMRLSVTPSMSPGKQATTWEGDVVRT